MRIAVVADIHATTLASSTASRVTASPRSAGIRQQPLEDLLEYVRHEGMRADYLLSAGDHCDAAEPAGLAYSWGRLHEIAAAMGAKLLATPGNHDVSTRDPSVANEASLLSLAPSFPSGHRLDDASFWRQGFLVHESGELRIIILNSCFDYPPTPPDTASAEAKKEHADLVNRGGFPESLEEQLRAHLALSRGGKLNLLLLHHHPIEHQLKSYFRDGYGPMRRGQELLGLLDDFPDLGRWLIIHGHKHIPQLVHAAGGATAPFVLCAASLGAKLWDPIITVTRNQVHFITLDSADRPRLGALKGTIRSYMWGYGPGWLPSSRFDSGLPSWCGFGASVTPGAVAKLVAEALSSKALRFMNWHELEMAVPEVQYLMPGDFTLMEKSLQNLSCQILRDMNDVPVQIARV